MQHDKHNAQRRKWISGTARRYTTPTLPQVQLHVQVQHSFGVHIALAAGTMVWLGSRALPHPHWCDSVVTRCAALLSSLLYAQDPSQTKGGVWLVLPEAWWIIRPAFHLDMVVPSSLFSLFPSSSGRPHSASLSSNIFAHAV